MSKTSKEIFRCLEDREIAQRLEAIPVQVTYDYSKLKYTWHWNSVPRVTKFKKPFNWWQALKIKRRIKRLLKEQGERQSMSRPCPKCGVHTLLQGLQTRCPTCGVTIRAISLREYLKENLITEFEPTMDDIFPPKENKNEQTL